jgi:triosephosphate isomerase (TIM)
MRKKIVMGNWKMNGRLPQVDRLLNDLLVFLPESLQSACVVFPPSIYLPRTCEVLIDSSLMWGAQNVYPKECGAYTGELSAPMLKDYGCRYVLVGHSERRSLFHEDEKFVAEKFHHVKEHGMIPVLCIGETLQAREEGLTEQVLEQQLLAVIKNSHACFDHCVLAYEPVWAIGTGQTATPDQIQAVHSFIRRYVADYDTKHAEQVQIVYGGSVSEKNAQAIFAMPDVDGGLVGGASLNARQFVEIVKCINCY